jgi:hypothetical protein
MANPSLKEASDELTGLILSGRTLEALERFYAPDIEMQENDHPPRIGKALCMETEQDNLSRVSVVTPILLSREIDESLGTVRTVWEFHIIYKDGIEYHLREVSVQQWKNGLVSRERFTYGRD